MTKKVMSDKAFKSFIKKLSEIIFTVKQKEVIFDVIVHDNKMFNCYSSMNKETKKIDTTYIGWAKNYRVLDGMLPEDQRIVWLVHKYGGFNPNWFDKKAWRLFIRELKRVSSGNIEIIEAGLKLGKTAREQGALSFKSPLAFRAFIIDYQSKQELGRQEDKGIWA